MKKTFVVIIFITMFSKILGLFRDVTLSFLYGTSGVSDAFVIATIIPITLFSFIAIGISSGFIPKYAEVQNKYGEQESLKFTNIFLNTIISITLAIIIIVILFTQEVIFLFASGLDGDAFDLAVRLTRISIISIFFSALFTILCEYSRIKGSFIIPAAIGIPYNVVIISFMLLSERLGYMYLGIGILFAALTQFLFILPLVVKKGYRYKLSLKIDKNVKNAIAISIPAILGVSANQINKILDQVLASRIVEGGITSLRYAGVLNGFVQGLFALTLGALIFPKISQLFAEGKVLDMKNKFVESVILLLLLITPVNIGFILYSKEITSLVFGRGAFDENSLLLTSTALFFYSVAIVSFCLRPLITNVFYAMKKSKIPMINGFISIGINVILSLILSRYMGIGGLALATSISATIAVILLWIKLQKVTGSLNTMMIFKIFIKILIAAAVAGAVSYFVKETLLDNTNLYIQAFFIVFIISIIYALMVILLKVEMALFVFKKIYYKIRK